jgi:tetratricopeptide (TPR) repeat protein
LPSSLKELIQARIDQPDRQRKLVLQCGSVLGRRFAVQILEFYEFIREGLLAKLYSLKALEFLDDELTPEGLDYLFRHHLTHEVSYSSLPERQRIEFHRIVGERIEDRFAPRLEEFYPLLAYHFSRSGLEDRAVDYLYKAGYRAARLGAVEEAFENLGDALLRVRRLSPTVARQRKELDVSIELTRLHRLTGDTEVARTICRKALKLATAVRAARETARLRTELGLLEILAGRPAEARHHLKEAMRRARRLGRDSLIGMIYNGLGICEFDAGNLRKAGALFGRTASLELERSKPRLAADAANNLAMVAWKQGDVQLALRRFRSARRLFERAHDRFGTAGTLMNIGIMEESMGRLSPSETHYREGLTQARDIHFPRLETAALANLASLALVQERFRDAQEFAAQSATVADSIGDSRAAAIALENLALAEMGLKAWREVRKHLQNARKLARRIRDKDRLLSLDLSELEEMLFKGKSSKVVLERMGSLKLALRCRSFPNERLRFLRLKAWALASAGKMQEAQRVQTEALHRARDQNNWAEVKRIRNLRIPRGKKG